MINTGDFNSGIFFVKILKLTVLNFNTIFRHELHEFTRIIIMVFFTNSCKFVAISCINF